MTWVCTYTQHRRPAGHDRRQAVLYRTAWQRHGQPQDHVVNRTGPVAARRSRAPTQPTCSHGHRHVLGVRERRSHRATAASYTCSRSRLRRRHRPRGRHRRYGHDRQGCAGQPGSAPTPTRASRAAIRSSRRSSGTARRRSTPTALNIGTYGSTNAGHHAARHRHGGGRQACRPIRSRQHRHVPRVRDRRADLDLRLCSVVHATLFSALSVGAPTTGDGRQGPTRWLHREVTDTASRARSSCRRPEIKVVKTPGQTVLYSGNATYGYARSPTRATRRSTRSPCPPTSARPPARTRRSTPATLDVRRDVDVHLHDSLAARRSAPTPAPVRR